MPPPYVAIRSKVSSSQNNSPGAAHRMVGCQIEFACDKLTASRALGKKGKGSNAHAGAAQSSSFACCENLYKRKGSVLRLPHASPTEALTLSGRDRTRSLRSAAQCGSFVGSGAELAPLCDKGFRVRPFRPRIGLAGRKLFGQSRRLAALFARHPR